MDTQPTARAEIAATLEYRPATNRARPAAIAATVILCLLAAVYVRTNVIDVLNRWSTPSDFDVYYRAAKDIAGGVSPYENPAYFYPPLAAFLMAPFAWANYHTARWIWLASSQVMLVAAAWLTWRASARRLPGLICVALIWAMGGASAETLRIGQLSPLLLVALAAAYSEHIAVQDTAVSAAFALKYFPGVVAVALWLQRGWRGVLKLTGIAFLAASVPWLVLAGFFTGPKLAVKAHYWLGTPSMFSWSLPSVVLRILLPIHRGQHLPFPWEYGNVAGELNLAPSLQMMSAAVALATLAGGILALIVACRGSLQPAQVPFAMAALVSLVLVAAPVSWTHYQVLQYPGVALLLNHAVRRRKCWTAAGIALCFALCYQLPELALIHYHDIHSGWTAYSPLTLYTWTSLPPFAALGLFAFALSMVRSEKGPPAAERRPLTPHESADNRELLHPLRSRPAPPALPARAGRYPRVPTQAGMPRASATPCATAASLPADFHAHGDRNPLPRESAPAKTGAADRARASTPLPALRGTRNTRRH